MVAITLRKPESGLSQWTTREVARRTGVSHTTVHRIWKAHDLKPHRLETFKFITDPDAEERIHDVVGLYLNPPTNAIVLSFDEKTQIQALERTQPRLPVRPGLSDTTPAVRRWLEENPRVHLHFTPKGASWRNLIEAWFGILTRKSIRRGSFPKVSALLRHIAVRWKTRRHTGQRRAARPRA